MDTTTGISLGSFRKAISGLKPPRLVLDNPLEPLSLKMQADSIHVIIGANPYISLRSGDTNITLSHVQTVRPSIWRDQKSYNIVCGDYSTSDIPRLIKYRLVFPD